MTAFSPKNHTHVARFVEEEMLALVTTHDEHGYISTPLPLVAEVDQSGKIDAFIGHFAIANPHLARVDAQPRVQIAFLGPHGYISPKMVSAQKWGPTWNYRLAQFEADVTLEPLRTREAIVALVDALEGTGEGAWTVDQMGDRFERMAAQVVAFRARVISVRAKFKLGQDEKPRTFNEIVASLVNRPLAQAMQDQVRSTREDIPTLRPDAPALNSSAPGRSIAAEERNNDRC